MNGKTNRRKLRRALALVALIGGCGPATASSSAAAAGLLDVVSDPLAHRPAFEIIRPEVGAPPSVEAALEARLQALAKTLELRTSLEQALIEFDVDGLSRSVQEIVAGIEDQAQISVHVRDLESQHVLFDYYGDQALNPASNQKLLTSSAALDLLGSDYVFETTVAVAGDRLYLRGQGDPTVSHDDLRALAVIVADTVPVAGYSKLVVDSRAFSDEIFGPGVDADVGPGYAYTAPSGALSVDFNTVAVTVYPLKKGRALAVHVVPTSPDIIVDNRGRVGTRDEVRIESRAAGEKTKILVSGTLRRGARSVTERRRIYRPALHAGAVFAELLAQESSGAALLVEEGVMPKGAEVLAVHESAPLVEVLGAGLAYSNNFIAEQVLRTLAWRMTGGPGDWTTGIAVLRGYWGAMGSDPTDIVLVNASGLSESGRVTSSGLVDLISVAHRAKAQDAGLLDVLPVAGEPGTLRTRLRMSGKRVRAKTGTLDGVSGLSGVVTREDGTPQIAFSILINAAPEATSLVASRRRAVEDRIVLSVLRYLDDFEARRTGLLKSARG